MEIIPRARGRGRGRGRTSELLFVNLIRKKNDDIIKKREEKVEEEEQFQDSVNCYKTRLSTFSDNVCLCERKSVEVRCSKCSKIMKGRPTVNCPQHKNVIHLMDILHCPHCHTKI